MSDADSRGPQVESDEELHRLITTPDWWVANAQRPSSAAFDEPKFSVNIASLTTIEETTRQLREVLQRRNGGIVAFQSGEGRQLGFDARKEIDEQYPNNDAHAHVYYDGSKSSRKKNARRLAQQCRLILEPTF